MGFGERKKQPKPLPTPKQVDTQGQGQGLGSQGQGLGSQGQGLGSQGQGLGSQGGWQLLLAFGVSFALRVYVLGFWLGGFLDKKFAGNKGYFTLVCVVLTIFYSLYMLYRDLLRAENRTKANRK